MKRSQKNKLNKASLLMFYMTKMQVAFLFASFQGKSNKQQNPNHSDRGPHTSVAAKYCKSSSENILFCGSFAISWW